MTTKIAVANTYLVTALSLSLIAGCAVTQDEAKRAGKTPADFPQTAVDVFKDMDGGIALTPDEVRGRNTWMLWTGGNQAFWDYLSTHSFGNTDLLKILDSRKRGYRFEYYGLINEPGLGQATEPDQYGLWMDQRVGPEPAGIDPEVYGRSSGVVGLRLFPNPNFDDEAKTNWDADAYFNDQDYYNDPDLVRPYRVGMSCAFCHVGPHPLNPPADPEHPEWANLSANVGAQYFWAGRIFMANPDEESFVWQLFNSYPPGTLDTSIIASDNVNNPRTMNAIYNVGARLAVAEEEELAGGSLDIRGAQARMTVPHILKDGSDSVGILGALNRVYINIGTFHQEWVQNFKLLIGGKQTPMSVKNAQENSVFWVATEQRVDNLAEYFLKSAGPMYLKDAPGGARYLTEGPALVKRGKTLFADNCASCHSSKQPPRDVAAATPRYRDWMREAVQKTDFLDGNYLSNDRRYPVSQIKTNACSTLATNGMRRHIWDNFTSETYKSLPPVGTIEVQHPLDGTTSTYDMPGGGRGYHRTPSLVSMWSTAPYLHNNALGRFTNDPSVAGRMAAFDDSVEKLLWPEKRKQRSCSKYWDQPFCPPIYRTTKESYLKVPHQYVPDILKITDLVDDEGNIEIGPIPKGTPISLVSNIDLGASKLDLAKVLIKVKIRLKRARGKSEEEQKKILSELVPDLLSVNKCPDFVVDRGHEFGSHLTDQDKRALIGYLKTL